jgi:hypothetical protein
MLPPPAHKHDAARALVPSAKGVIRRATPSDFGVKTRRHLARFAREKSRAGARRMTGSRAGEPRVATIRGIDKRSSLCGACMTEAG